jgi:bifunctional non-homologous end joining protein LigD
MRLAQIVLVQCEFLKTVPSAAKTDEKRALWNKVKAAHGEGVVFKRLDCPVREGRPNSGGDWLKYKFTETASCFVLGSIPAGAASGSGCSIPTTPMRSGKMMIPAGNDGAITTLSAAGDIAEWNIRTPASGGSLYQRVSRQSERPVYQCLHHESTEVQAGRRDEEEHDPPGDQPASHL